MEKILRGSLVRFTSEFLSAVSWHTDVPINGIVLEVIDRGFAHERALVWWNDEDPQEATRVLLKNLELAPADKTITDSMREVLLLTADCERGLHGQLNQNGALS